MQSGQKIKVDPAVMARGLVWEYFGDALKAQHYRVLYIDPAWKFSAGKSKNPSLHYRTMPVKDIMAMPIKALAHPEGCRVYMWVTVPHLRNGFRVLDAWGARYSSARVWVKLWDKENGLFLYPDSFARGTGLEIAGDAEMLLIGKFGRPERAPNPKPRNTIFAPRREHSRKPAKIREWIEQTFKGPKAELFSRVEREGWDVWGDQVGKFDD